MAWHKSFPGTPSLPHGWVECNGQTLVDPESLYDGQVLPDLNGLARFLRGGTASGTLQADSFGSHSHVVGSYATADAGQHSHSANTSIGSVGNHSHNSAGGHAHRFDTVRLIPPGLSTGVSESGLGSRTSENTGTVGHHAHPSAGGHYHSASTSIGTVGYHNHVISGNSESAGESETKPINMSVVWIIRVK